MDAEVRPGEEPQMDDKTKNARVKLSKKAKEKLKKDAKKAKERAKKEAAKAKQRAKEQAKKDAKKAKEKAKKAEAKAKERAKKAAKQVTPPASPDDIPLTDLNVTALRAIARQRGLPGYSRLTREQLLDTL
ncbi:MAG TPA: hypothetical protein VK595_06710 [Vicinamibacterales bacterium]|nr:hypothetical protein [Vicinamibacterales bacterium]